MKKLDRSRSYGQVFGDASHSFEQDGRKFDHEGNEVDAPDAADGGSKNSKGSTDDGNQSNPLEELLAVGQDKVIAALATVKRADLVKLLAMESHETEGKKRARVIKALETEIADRPADDADQLETQLQ